MWLRQILGASLSGLLLSVAVQATVAQPAIADTNTPCVNGGYSVVYARGSGAWIHAGEAQKFKGQIASRLQMSSAVNWAELGNLDNDVSPGDFPNEKEEYPAVYGFQWVAFPGYGGSVRIGTDELVGYLNARAERCPYETIVLGGYSQGADVIGWALERTGGGDSWSLNAHTRNRIGAVALYGDPKYLGNLGRIGGCFQPPWAILDDCNDMPRSGFLGSRNPYVPSDIWSRISSYCVVGDGMCDINEVDIGFNTHSTAYTSWAITASANRIAAIAISKRNQLNPNLPAVPGGIAPASGPPPAAATNPPPAPSRQLFLRGDSAVFAKDGLENGGWTQESDPGSIREIAVGGPYQMVLNACNAVYARSDIGRDGWVQETPCGGANKIAISNTGLQMLIDACGAV